MESREIRFIRLGVEILMVLASLITIAIALNQACPHQESHFTALLAAFIAWAISPYVGLFVVGHAMKRLPAGSVVVSFGSTVAVAAGMWFYYEGFYLHPDAQSGILFIFIPLYQWAWTVFIGVIALVACLVFKTRPN